MRIHQAERRVLLMGISDSNLFTPELEYYRTNNQYAVTIFGKPLVNIYKNINVQIVITRSCQVKCPFCIENDNILEDGKLRLSFLVESVLRQYALQGITPTVSITGGEPTLMPNRLQTVLDIVKSYPAIRTNINTNGYDLKLLQGYTDVRINLSRHSFLPQDNKEIFGDNFHENIVDFTDLTLQCVLMKKYISTVKLLKNYMEHYILLGASGFSFRGLTTLDEAKGYQFEKQFTASNQINIKEILDEVACDPDFEFVQQKIGDHYVFEIYKYKGKYVRFTYSNFAWLRQVETEERKSNNWFSRATIIHPNAVYAGWTYDINKIQIPS